MGHTRKPTGTTESSTGFLIGFLDPHTLISESLRSLLKAQRPSVSVVSAPTPELLLEVLEKRKGPPNVIIIHVGSVLNESETFVMAATMAREAFPDVPVGILSDAINGEELLLALKTGADFYFNSAISADVLCYQLRLVARGDVVGIVSNCVENAADGKRTSLANLHLHNGRALAEHVLAEHSGQALTVRESQVLRHLTKGSSNKIIGAELGMRESTVKLHVHNIMKKIGAHNRTELAVMMFQENPT